MTVHMETVHKADHDKKFQCKDCVKGFIDKKSLQAHMNIHLKVKPYRCREGCDMAYSDSSNRNQHERRVHGARGGMQRGAH